MAGAAAATGVQLLSHFGLNPERRYQINKAGLALGFLAGPVTWAIFKEKSAQYRRDIKQINTLFQLDDAILIPYINGLNLTIALTSAGLPHPFIDTHQARIHLPKDARSIIASARRPIFKTPAEQAEFIRSEFKNLIQNRILKIHGLYRALLPINGFLWGTLGLSLADFHQYSKR